MPTYEKNTIASLIDGELPWPQVKSMMSDYKDADRFDKYVAVLQERVRFPERILLPIGEHLHIVSKGKERIVKCDCGHDFGDYQQNWKLRASIRVRATDEELEPIYSGPRKCDPAWMEIREFICPNCSTLLEVEAAPPGYPIIFDFLPDLESFYQNWLGRALP
jgi:acetone carboxylase, gamma subunit